MIDADVIELQPYAIEACIQKNHRGKIKIGAQSKSSQVIKITGLILIFITIFGFCSFDYQNIDFAKALSDTLHNIGIVFAQPALHFTTFQDALYQLLITFCMGLLSTFIGAFIAFFAALLCARNISNPRVATVVKSIVAFVRAVPTILWMLIFAVSAGLGSVSAVMGLSFHSAAYLTKAYSESIEEMDSETIEALKASGANYWQIVFQAIVPASMTYMLAWTFLRFEINFTNAIAVGAAAGAGGIGFNLFMAGSFYLDLHEMGFITYIVVIAVILLEVVATNIKARVK